MLADEPDARRRFADPVRRAQLNALRAGAAESRALLDDVRGIASEDEAVEDVVGDEPGRGLSVAEPAYG